jgi:Tol biopolymer transport system component
VLAALPFAAMRLMRSSASGARGSFQTMRFAKLTTSGRATVAALSPDGKYVAHVMEDGGFQSVWVRQVAALSNVQVVPPGEVDYLSLAFSRDGNYIYYVLYGRPRHLGVLYREPALGGTPQRLLEDIDSGVGLSPDGAALAFIRNYVDRDETALMSARADGTGERRLASRRQPDYYSIAGPAWSPDGKLIAVAAGRIGPSRMSVVGVRTADGVEQTISDQAWARVGELAWLSDQSGLVAVARPAASPVFASQIWRIPYPAGDPQRITNDLNGYGAVSLSADSKSLVTLQSSRVARIWIAPDGDAGRATQIASGFIDTRGEILGIAWLADGRIVYGSHAGGNPDLWVMNADGSSPRQLTVEAAADSSPAVSPDGRFIAFVSDRAGSRNIWRIDADGGNPVRLTRGQGEDYPAFTPDGRSVVYTSFGSERTSLWRVPFDGGDPRQLTDTTSFMPVVSPDGTRVACYVMDPRSLQMKLGLISIADGKVERLFDTPLVLPPILRFAPDGRSLSYIDTRGGVSNLWMQPLDGSAPRPVTAFRSELMYRFAWSRDGHRLACERGIDLNDVALITNF